jgi:hypothetical protein
MVALIRKLLWSVAFLVMTLAWVTLLQHGPEDFVGNLKKEINGAMSLIPGASKAPAKKAP